LNSLRISRARLALLFAVALYITVFNLTYKTLVVPVFGAWGFGSPPLPAFYFFSSVVLCLVPALWMPVRFSRPSLLLFYIQYFLIYIPASFIVYTSTRPELLQTDAFALVLAMFVGLSLMQAVYLIPVRPIRVVRLTPEAFWLIFAIGASVMFLYLLVKLGGTFRLVSFEDVYTLRSEMSETITATGSRFGLYAHSLLSALVLPLLFATGIASRRYWVILPVVLGYIFLFGVGGAKAAALAVIYLPLAALLLSRSPRRIPVYFVSGLSLALVLGYVSRAILPAQLHLMYTAVVHFRLFTVPPLTIPQYFDFFQTHPVTHLAQVTGLNWLLHNPYDADIPYTIGAYFYGGPVGLNSGLWAGDGLTGFGIWGIPLVSVICALIFWLVDSASAEFDPRFVGLALIFCTVFFGNVSLFTTLVTGGLALVMAAMLIAPRDVAGHIRVPRFAHLRSIPTAETL
jgi:O-antigen polymerase